MATLGLKKIGKFLWESREKGLKELKELIGKQKYSIIIFSGASEFRCKWALTPSYKGNKNYSIIIFSVASELRYKWATPCLFFS